MTTEIYSQNHGRGLSTYDLLIEVQEDHGLERAEAHEAIHAMLTGIIEAEGDTVILESRPARPELIDANHADSDIDQWLTISDATAKEIREALAVVYAA